MDGSASAPQMENRTIAVTGATGFVGRHLCKAITGAGGSVRALARDAEKARQTLPDAGVEIIVGDIFDPASVDRLVQDADAVMHLIGIRRELSGGVTFKRLHVEATRRALEAAQGAGVRRYLQMSALGARTGAPAEYHQTKLDAEKLVRASDLDWTILRPSLIHGPDGEFMQLAAGWCRGTEPPYIALPYFFRAEPLPGEDSLAGRAQPIDVRDVAAAFIAALDEPESIGEVFELGGPERLDWVEMLERIHERVPHANEKLKPRGVPGMAAHYIALGASKMGAGSWLPFGPSEPLMAIEDNTCSIVKARRLLGFEPRSFVPALEEYAHLL